MLDREELDSLGLQTKDEFHREGPEGLRPPSDQSIKREGRNRHHLTPRKGHVVAGIAT